MSPFAWFLAGWFAKDVLASLPPPKKKLIDNVEDAREAWGLDREEKEDRDDEDQ